MALSRPGADSPEASGNRKDRSIVAPEWGRRPGARVPGQALPPLARATHRRLKVEPRKEGLRASAAVATV